MTSCVLGLVKVGNKMRVTVHSVVNIFNQKIMQFLSLCEMREQ